MSDAGYPGKIIGDPAKLVETHAAREHAADERQFRADERERLADERQVQADEREARADERERLADQREQAVGRQQARRERQQAEVERASAEVELALATTVPDPAAEIERSRRLRQKILTAIEAFAASEAQIARLYEDLAASQPGRREEYRRIADQARDTARKAREVLRAAVGLPSR